MYTEIWPPKGQIYVHFLAESEILTICWLLARPTNCKKNVVIQSAATSAQGGCASSRLDHGLKFYVIQGGCASSRLIHGFSDCDTANLRGVCILSKLALHQTIELCALHTHQEVATISRFGLLLPS